MKCNVCPDGSKMGMSGCDTGKVEPPLTDTCHLLTRRAIDEAWRAWQPLGSRLVPVTPLVQGAALQQPIYELNVFFVQATFSFLQHFEVAETVEATAVK
jgi:hypothetical protein